MPMLSLSLGRDFAVEYCLIAEMTPHRAYSMTEARTGKMNIALY